MSQESQIHPLRQKEGKELAALNVAPLRFMIVDDHQSIRKLCMTVGASLGLHCTEAESAESALAHIETEAPEIVLADLMMPHMSGLEFMAEVHKILPHTEVAIMTGHGTIETAVQAMRLGAYDYITKPFRIDELKILLQRMSEKVSLVAENNFLRERVSTEMSLNGIIGSSANIQGVMRMVARLKDTRTPVLITGESGTGKELVARAIHERGALAKRPFVAVDCGSLVPTLIESELFGYEKGAFTGANRAKEGLFQAAQGGTIFLDEIGELPLELQAKLLRVLQEKEVRPVGSNQRVAVDVRVIAATNRDLEQEYHAGRFRKDLYFRLNVVTVHLPPLRERRSDIPALIHWFLERFSPGEAMQVSQEAMDLLLRYEWPGNVRELENCIQRAVALGSREVLGTHDLPPAIHRVPQRSGFSARVSAAGRREMSGEIASPNFPVSADTSDPVDSMDPGSDLEALERDTIRRVFEQTNGDKRMTQRLLGISRATLYRKLKRYNILN